LSMQNKPIDSVIACANRILPSGEVWILLTALIWHGVPTRPTLVFWYSSTADRTPSNVGLTVYFVPAPLTKSSYFVATSGFARHFESLPATTAASINLLSRA